MGAKHLLSKISLGSIEGSNYFCQKLIGFHANYNPQEFKLKIIESAKIEHLAIQIFFNSLFKGNSFFSMEKWLFIDSKIC